MSKKITDTEFLTADQIRHAHKDRKTILKSYGSFHAKLVSLFAPRMEEFKATKSKVKSIKEMRLAYNAEMCGDAEFKELYSDTTGSSLSSAISFAWKTVEGTTTKVAPSKTVVDCAGTAQDMNDETTWPEFIDILSRMYLMLSPANVEKFDAKVETLHTAAAK